MTLQARVVGLSTVLFGLGMMQGCSSPFAPVSADFAPPISLERFRAIDPIQFKVAPPEQAQQDPALIARDRFEGLSQIELSLQDCRASALANNLDLKVTLVNPAIANESLSVQEAAFESAFTTNAIWSQTDTPTASTLTDAQAEFGQVTPGVRIPMRSGGTATITLPMNRTKTNNQFSTLNPSYTADLRFSLSQPLLRNAGRRTATHGIRIASYDSQIVQARTRASVIGQLSAVDRAYWRLYQFRAELGVRQEELELAQEQRARAQRRVQAGDAAEIEVLRAEAGVASSLEAIIVAQNAVLTGQRELKRIINRPGLDVATRTMIVPSTPPDPVLYEFDVEALTERALAERMELLELELQAARDEANITFNENQAMPALDLTASYTINGLGGSINDAYDVLRDNNFEDWSVGVNLSVPLGNEVALARLRQAVLTRIQRIGTRQAREQTIRQEVYDAVDRLDADWQRLLATRQSVILNTRTLEAEQRQFDQGRSTSTDVLDRQKDLTAARSSEIRAIVSYQITQINLAQATGTLLGAARVGWEPIEAPRLGGTRMFPRARIGDNG
ncbi:MAG: TolC family protein [Planctomycetes bacterium]|nr:TolC family protein [Planctomycetota bacterium]